MAGAIGPEHKHGDGFWCWCHGANVVYSFKNRGGQEIFQKVRRAVDPVAHARGKAMRYRWRQSAEAVWVWRKPETADALLYGMEQDLTGKVYLVEGEKDADSLRRLGLVAVSHHQGGENPMNAGQAGWLAEAKKVILVADKDDAGAYCAATHYNLLRDLGVKASIVRAAVGKDATDHLEAGYSPREFVPVNWKKFAKRAKDYAKFKSGGVSNRYPYRANVKG